MPNEKTNAIDKILQGLTDGRAKTWIYAWITKHFKFKPFTLTILGTIAAKQNNLVN